MADIDQNGSVLARYAETQNIDEPLAELRSGTTSYYEADGLGSVTSLSSGAGAIANTYTYDSFGKLTASTGSITNRFQYTAREFDSESGLYYYRARYYDPTTGRFISEDPHREILHGMDFYPYVRNSAPNLIDPDGRSPVDWGKWEKIFKGVAIVKGFSEAFDWGLWRVHCMLCTAFQTRADLDRSYGRSTGMSSDGYTNNLLRQSQQTGSGDADFNQHVVCVKGDPNCEKCEKGGENISLP